MMTQQKKVNAISGNIANVSTPGYKKLDVNFKDLFYSAFNGDNDETYQIGNGVAVKDISKDFKSGVLMKTENELDLAIDGPGFFKVSNSSNDAFYTRGGSLSVSVEQDNSYLVDNNGLYLMDENNSKIEIGQDYGKMIVDNKGTIVFENSDQTYQLNLVSFNYPDKLNVYGSSLYSQTLEAGEEQANNIGSVKQNYIENSNVDLAVEMTDLIKVQRLYEMNSKLIQVIDDMQSLANRLRR